MNARIRKAHREASNNSMNPNQNVCAQRVAVALGVADSQRYLHTFNDCCRAARSRYSVRSIKSMVKATSVGAMRKGIEGLDAAAGLVAVMVYVDGHVLLMDHTGKTIIDTDPRLRDRRKVIKVMGVYAKA